MKKLPVGVQAFDVMRTQGFVYVDKTRWIHQLVTEGIYYFLARPRRFGKSLLVSTLRRLFEGRRDLFEGLWIADEGRWDWRPHPVVVLDFNQMALDTPERLEADLGRALEIQARQAGIVLENPTLVSRFTELLVALHRQARMPAVVLIDEYDKPLIEHLGRGEAGLATAQANRDILRGFYGVLKGADVAPVTRFVLLTGVSRFSRVSVFSALNNLQDISLSTRYAAILGYTRQELSACFEPHLTQFATEAAQPQAEIMARLAHHYNGYRFSTKDIRVYNPFSVLSALSEMDFGNYWFETGTPLFLINLLKEKQCDLPTLEGLQADQATFSTFELERLTPEALLFQTGYLTIADVQDGIYTLDYPNQEVKTSFTKSLLFSTERIVPDASSHVLRLSGYLQAGDMEAFFASVKAVFASIPCDIQTKRDEAYYHTLFYLMLSASGGRAQSSLLTARGRIDMLITLPDRLYIIEFKCNQSAEAALRQIRDQGYIEPYVGCGKAITLMGLNFSTELRNVEAWAVEDV